MKKILLLLTTSIVPSLQSNAQTVSKHPIDELVERCHLDTSNHSTLGMVACEEFAYKLWDQLLNTHYQELMKQLKPDEKKALRISQRSWITYRDQEQMFFELLYFNNYGTLWGVLAANKRSTVTRTRALELKEYLDALE